MNCKQALVFFLLIASSFTLYAQRKTITIDDICTYNTFQYKNVPGFNSMKDGRFYAEIDSAGNLIKKAFATGETVAVLAKRDDIRTKDNKTLPLIRYAFSNGERKILLNVQIRYIYRRSYSSIPYVYNLKTHQVTQVSETPVLHATFSPDGTKVAFVKNNNLFYLNLINDSLVQVTRDGKQNSIINGNCDWVYEEEFEFTRAFEWSPNGKQIAYYRFDESRVPEYTIPFYEDTSNYPILYTYKYPKAGEPNSTVSIHIFDLQSRRNTTVDVGDDPDQYIPRIKWTAQDNMLCVYRMNRLQNRLELLLANANSGRVRILYKDTDQWYIDEGLLDDLYFLHDGKHFIIMNEKDGWRHLYLYDMEGKLLHKLTDGHWDVDKIAGVDEAAHIIYYTAAYHSPMDRQLFSSDLNGKHFHQITHERGWHDVEFNSDYTYFLDKYSTINTPPSFTIKNSGGKVVRDLEDNKALNDLLETYSLSRASFLKIPNREGLLLNAWMLKPPHFDSTRKYPVLFANYGGPGSQSVKNSWGTINFWEQMLAEKGYIIICVDNTGTGFRGELFKKKETYLQLGWKEIHDQIDAAKWISAHFSFINSSRIGHWGWSFGGFLSSLAITVGADVFHTAVAVAPVTDWRYYDNIYTERYMRTPQENPDGYKKTSPIRYVDKLKGKFLLIHGTGDDNVHFQNSIMLSEALIQANKAFQQAYYPNKNHGIYGGNTRLQLYSKMTTFILDNL